MWVLRNKKNKINERKRHKSTYKAGKKKKKIVVKGHLAVPINTTLYDILCFLSPHQSMSHWCMKHLVVFLPFVFCANYPLKLILRCSLKSSDLHDGIA